MRTFLISLCCFLFSFSAYASNDLLVKAMHGLKSTVMRAEGVVRKEMRRQKKDAAATETVVYSEADITKSNKLLDQAINALSRKAEADSPVPPGGIQIIDNIIAAYNTELAPPLPEALKGTEHAETFYLRYKESFVQYKALLEQLLGELKSLRAQEFELRDFSLAEELRMKSRMARKRGHDAFQPAE